MGKNVGVLTALSSGEAGCRLPLPGQASLHAIVRQECFVCVVVRFQVDVSALVHPPVVGKAIPFLFFLSVLSEFQYVENPFRSYLHGHHEVGGRDMARKKLTS